MPSYCGRNTEGVTETGHLYRGNIAGFVCRCYGEGWTQLSVYDGAMPMAGIRNGRFWIHRDAA